MISLEEFKSLVNQAVPRLTRSTPPQEAMQFVGLKNEGMYSREMVKEKLRGRVHAAFKSGHQAVFSHCAALTRELVTRHEAYGEPRDPYYEVLWALRDSVRSDESGVNVVGDWQVAVHAAMDLSSWIGPTYTLLYEQSEQRNIAFARALKKVGRVGASGRNDEVPEDRNRAAMARRVEKLVAHMGGIAVMKRLAVALEPKFDPQMGRYLDVEQFSFGGAPMKLRTPYGFLFNLAAKHPIPKKPLRTSDADWNELVGLSQHFAALYQAQAANYFELMFANATTMLPLMQRLSIRDALFSPAQMRGGDVARMLRGILDGASGLPNVAEEALAQGRMTVDVIEGIIRLVGGRRGPVLLKEGQIQQECSALKPAQVRDTLASVLAHRVGSCNAKYRRPDEVPDQALPRESRAGANVGDKPLIALGAGEYALLSESFCAPAMIEAVLTQLRLSGVDAQIGLAVEAFLLQELRSRGIQVSTGKYTVGKKTWECDLVIQTQNRVVFVEMKKKSLTRAARAGLDVALLIDMADSLVSATLQAMRHEDQIRCGPLALKQPDGSIDTVELKNRQVERIAMTLPDFGGFQDRAFLETLLHAQMRLEFSTPDAEFAKKIAALNEKLNDLRESNVRLYEHAGKPKDWRPFFSSWFLSVPQFLLLLDNVSNGADFERELAGPRAVTTGHKDFYVDLHAARSLHRTP